MMAWEDEMEDMADAVVEAFGVSIQIQHVTSGARNSSTGVRAKTISTVTVNATRSESRNDGNRVFVVYVVAVADLGSFVPDKDDVVHDPSSGVVYQRTITNIEYQCDRTMLRLTTARSQHG